MNAFLPSDLERSDCDLLRGMLNIFKQHAYSTHINKSGFFRLIIRVSATLTLAKNSTALLSIETLTVLFETFCLTALAPSSYLLEL